MLCNFFLPFFIEGYRTGGTGVGDREKIFRDKKSNGIKIDKGYIKVC